MGLPVAHRSEDSVPMTHRKEHPISNDPCIQLIVDRNFFSLPTLTQQHNDNRNNEGLNEFNESGHFPLSDCATSLDSLTPTQTGSRKYSHRQSTRGSKGCQSFCGTSCTPSGNFGQGPDPGSYKCDEGNGNDDSGSGGGGNGDDGDAAYDPKHPDSHGSLVECPWRHCDYSIEDKNRLKYVEYSDSGSLGAAKHFVYREHLKRSHLKGLQCPQSGCQHTYGDHGLIKRHLKSNVHGIASDSISDKPGRPQTLSELKHIQQKLLFEDGCFDSPYMAIICQADSPADLLKKGNLKRLVEEAQRSWDKLTNSTVQDALEHFRKLPDTSNRDAQAVGVIKSLLLKEYVDQGTDERSFEDWSQYILKLTYDYIAPPAALSWRHNDLSEVLAARETQNSERPIANDSGLGSSGSPGGIDPIP